MNDFENEAIGQATGERIPKESGDRRSRTDDPLLAKQML